jgi:hypothetical protein
MSIYAEFAGKSGYVHVNKNFAAAQKVAGAKSDPL